MITIRPQDAVHKAYLLRLLTNIVDNPVLSQAFYFKGGTCASMMGILDRFSVDLDFDIKPDADEKKLKTEFYQVFKKLDFSISTQSQKALEFFLKYSSKPNQRSTLKVDALNFQVKANKYSAIFLPEINRIVNCQTKETIFANKLVAIKDRYDRRKTIAGRDIYDIHHFFITGLRYDQSVIFERTGLPVVDYLRYLKNFIKNKVTSTLIDQDLNTLLPIDTFKRIRKTLKDEVVLFINDEIVRLESNV